MTTTTKVPGIYPVALNGRPYLASFDADNGIKRSSIPIQKAQQDTGDTVGEQSLSSEDLWRRAVESWHRGAGQSEFDGADSDPFRFDDSWGVDPWTKRRLSLLNDTERKLASTNTVVKLAVAGTRLYCIDGQVLKYTTTITPAGVATWTTVTGTPAVTPTAITSDGYNVWVAYGASGIYQTNRTIGVASRYSNMVAGALEFVKGRLMASVGNAIFNVTSNAPTDGTITYRGVTVDSTDTAVTSKTLNYPSGTLPGDLLVMDVATPTGASERPAGWTRIQGASVGSIFGEAYWRIAGNETSVTAAFSTSVRSVVILGVWTGAATTGPSSNTSNTNSATTAAASASGAPGDGDLHTFFTNVAGSRTHTPPTSFTERADAATATASVSAELADFWLADDAYPGVLTATLSSASDSVVLAAYWPAAAPLDPLLTSSNPDFTWVGFAEGQGDIYAAGYSGDKSLIYKTQIRDDATALDAPSIAGSLPDGEIVRSIYGYLGIIFIGTDSGVRMARSDGNGNLIIGSLIPTSAPVRCFEGQGSSVWFGLEQFDVSRWTSGTIDGLGRLFLEQETKPNTPAYASDLTVAGSTGTTEQVQSVATFQSRRVLSIADSGGASRGVYAETATKVTAGYVDSGLISYRLPYKKLAVYLDLRHRALPASTAIQVYLSVDEGAFTSIGSSGTAATVEPSTPLDAGPSRGNLFELRAKLTSAGDAVGPVLTHLTLRSEPSPPRGEFIEVSFLLFEDLTTDDGSAIDCHPATELAAIRTLFATQDLVQYQEGSITQDVFLKDFRFHAEKPTENGQDMQGICTVLLKAPGV